MLLLIVGGVDVDVIYDIGVCLLCYKNLEKFQVEIFPQNF